MNETISTSVTDDDRAVASMCFGFNLRKAARAVSQVYDTMLEPAGLKGTQFSLLLAASIAVQAPVGQLAEILVMDRTTLTRNLQPLISRGFVELVPGADKRMKLVKLTRSGRHVLEQARPLWREAQAAIKAGIGAETHNQILNNLAQVTRVALDSRQETPSG
jgi:DNA-binding MarR family transcriptional regulator